MKKAAFILTVLLCSVFPFVASAEEQEPASEQTVAENEVIEDVSSSEESSQTVEYNVVIDWPTEPFYTIQIAEEDYNNQNNAVPFITGSAYQGSFNSTALNYFTGVMMNNVGKDYVAFRGSQYVYYLFFGDDIVYGGSRFTGSDLSFVSYNSYDGTIERGTDSLSINPNATVVYSNVDDTFAHFVEVRNVEETRVNSILVASCMLMLLFFWVWKR